jgi:hypothetical protein
VIHAEDFFKMESAEELMHYLGPKKCQLKYYFNVGHLPHVTQPDRVIYDIE